MKINIIIPHYKMYIPTNDSTMNTKRMPLICYILGVFILSLHDLYLIFSIIHPRVNYSCINQRSVSLTNRNSILR